MLVTLPCCFSLHLTPPLPTPFAQVYRLITKGTVDQNIYNLSQRKLRMDSAVLDGITSGKGGKADESAQMGFILHVRGPGSWDAALCLWSCLCWSETRGCNVQLAAWSASPAAHCHAARPLPHTPCIASPSRSRSSCHQSTAQRASRPMAPRHDLQRFHCNLAPAPAAKRADISFLLTQINPSLHVYTSVPRASFSCVTLQAANKQTSQTTDCASAVAAACRGGGAWRCQAGAR